MALFGLDLRRRARPARRCRRRVRGRAASGRPAPGPALPRARRPAGRVRRRVPDRPARRHRRCGCPAAAWWSARDADGKPQRLVSIMADVTEAKQAEEQLRVERERLRLALSAGRMGAFELDIRTDALWWSPETYDLFGVDAERLRADARERPRRSSIPRTARTSCKRRADAIAGSKPFLDEFRIRRPDGSQVWIGYQGQAEYDADGQPLRTFGIVMDISERKHVEQILRDADQQKDDFIATLVARAAQSARADPQRRRHPSPPPADGSESRLVPRHHPPPDRPDDPPARRPARRLAARRGPSSTLRLRARSTLATVVEHAIEIAQPVIDAAGHALDGVDARREAAPRRRPDPAGAGLLQRPDQCGEVHAGQRLASRWARCAKAIRSRCGSRTPASASPKNTSAGSSRCSAQVESALDRAQGGQGIGLALAKGLVELHGGTIQARSEGLGKGSEFEIRLPAVP